VKQNRLLCPAGHLLYERRRFRKASSTEEVASRRLDGGVSGEQCSPLRFLFSKKGKQLLCPAGHLLYERRQFCKASSTEEVASRRLDGGVSGEQCSPLRFLFSKRVDNSSALPGISSGRGDNFAKPPLQRRWQAAGLTEESRANDVRPYGFSFQKGWTTPLPCRAFSLGKETLGMFHVKHCAAGVSQKSSG